MLCFVTKTPLNIVMYFFGKTHLYPPVPSCLVKSPPCIIKLGMIRWNVEFSIPNSFSPVQSTLKFSAVFGTTSPLNSTLICPKVSPFALTCKLHCSLPVFFLFPWIEEPLVSRYSELQQVNLCQKLLFLNQLAHNMTRDCSLNYKFNTWKFQAQTWGEHVMYRNCFWHL